MIQQLFDLSGRVALVSGAASGMGRAMALTFAEAGANLMLADLNAEGMAKTAAEILHFGRKAIPVRCDMSDTDQIRAMFTRLDKELGRIDVQANVAGEGILGTPEEISLDQVKQVFQNLAVARLFACQEGGRRMLAAGKGSIINVCSIAGVTALGCGHIAYSMAMGAVAQMTRELSTEWSGRGVRVNAILPAQVVNPSLQKRMAADPNLESQWLRGIPAGRMGKPDDVRGLALFLASDASAWVTGTLIPMDGGNLAANAGATIKHR